MKVNGKRFLAPKSPGFPLEPLKVLAKLPGVTPVLERKGTIEFNRMSVFDAQRKSFFVCVFFLQEEKSTTFHLG